jgi:hypothetical protein
MRLRISIAALAAVCAALALPAVAPAEDGPAAGPVTIGLEVKAVDPASRTVQGILHCVRPELAGRPTSFHVADGVELADLAQGTVVGVQVQKGTPPEVLAVVPAPCSVQPGATGPADPGAAPQGPGDPKGDRQDGPDGGDGPPVLKGGFLNRVWKFVGEVDGYDSGKLSMTLDKILNLPRRFANQDDELVDQDTLVLVGSATRVYDKDGRARASDLENAEHVRVYGKLLRPAKWQKDEDGDPVPTIRAKKVYILD